MLQRHEPPLILASASASRRAVLAAAGVCFDTQPAEVDEAAIKVAAHAAGIDKASAALRLADAKARAIARVNPDALVIGADQILVADGVWFDKPRNTADAEQQLRFLRGRPHELVTAAVCHHGPAGLWQHVAIPRLVMRQFSDEFLRAYLAAEGPAVTATVGAYRLEGLGVNLFQSIEGEHAAILGLPLLALLDFLRVHGVLVC